MQRSAAKLGWKVAMGLGWACGMAAVSGSATSLAFGQSVAGSGSSEQLFGAAIHRYYDGQFESLAADLTASMDADVEDPRLFYLRGLAFFKAGQEALAKADLKQGAELEALQFGKRNYNIGRAFQRIQGNDRAMIELARGEAMQRRDQLRASKAGIPRSAILAEMGRSVMDPPVISTSRPNLPDPSTLSDPTAPFGDGEASAPRPRSVRSEAIIPATRPPQDGDQDDPFGTPPARNEAADPFGG